MALGYKETVDKAVKDHEIGKSISKFLYLIADNTLNDKTDRDSKNQLIRTLFREGFEIHDPSGTFKIGSKLIQQCLWRVMRKLKFLDYDLHCTGKDPSTERMTKEGVETVMDNGGLDTCFTSKGGVFQNATLLGDGYLFFAKGENDENPVSYRVLRNEDVYHDNFAYGVRGVRPANKMAVILQFDKDEAYESWPELEENGVYGKIPGTYQHEEDNTSNGDNNVLEVAWAWDRTARQHSIFAGVQAFLIEEFIGEEYPCMKRGKPYIPVFQFICQPSDEGFSNYGIGDMVYDLAVISRKLLNLEVGHVEKNVYPLTFLNASQSKVDELVEKMAMANKARAQGKDAFIGLEFDTNGGQQGVAAQTLLTQNLSAEWQMVWDRLVMEVARLGININDVSRGPDYTATQVYAEEQTGNDFVIQMQEYNAPETKELIECSMDAITEYVSHKNATPLNLRTRIKLPDQSTIKNDKVVTMGMLAKELEDNNYFVDVNKKTGANKSDLMLLTHLTQQLNVTPPGTPEFAELYRQMSDIRGIDIQLTSQPQGWQPPQQNLDVQALQSNMPVTPQKVTPEGMAKVMGGAIA